MAKKAEIKWLSEPEANNYPAALSYLCLIYDVHMANNYVNNLKKAIVSEFKAKDIFRASNLSLLGISNVHIKKNQQKIQSVDQLSPLLLVRDSINGKVMSVLVATSRFYDALSVLHFLIPLGILNLALVTLSVYLIIRSIIRIRFYDELLYKIKLKKK